MLLHRKSRIALVVVALGSASKLALAEPPPSGEEAQQTLVLQPIRSGFVFAPDFKFTDVDHNFGSLIGGYGGWLSDQRLLLGAGAYWLVNGSRYTGLSYGGAIVEWYAARSRPVTVSLRGLIGGGSGNLPVTLPAYPGRMYPQHDRYHDHGYPPPYPNYPTVGVAEVGFFVAEPQVNVSFTLSDWFRVGVGAGYRAIAGASGLESRLRGPSATISLQFGSF